MPYESEISALAQGALEAHDALDEVVFLQANNTSLLVFSDGTVLPTWVPERGDDAWQVMYEEVNKRPYLMKVAGQLGGNGSHVPPQLRLPGDWAYMLRPVPGGRGILEHECRGRSPSPQAAKGRNSNQRYQSG